MLEGIDDENLTGTGGVKHLQDEKPDRSRAQERNPFEETRLGEVDGMDRDPKRLEHDGLEWVEIHW